MIWLPSHVSNEHVAKTQLPRHRLNDIVQTPAFEPMRIFERSLRDRGTWQNAPPTVRTGCRDEIIRKHLISGGGSLSKCYRGWSRDGCTRNVTTPRAIALGGAHSCWTAANFPGETVSWLYFSRFLLCVLCWSLTVRKFSCWCCRLLDHTCLWEMAAGWQWLGSQLFQQFLEISCRCTEQWLKARCPGTRPYSLDLVNAPLRYLFAWSATDLRKETKKE